LNSAFSNTLCFAIFAIEEVMLYGGLNVWADLYVCPIGIPLNQVQGIVSKGFKGFKGEKRRKEVMECPAFCGITLQNPDLSGKRR